MRGPRTGGRRGWLTAMILGVLVQAAGVAPAAAQQPQASAVLKSVAGRVEISRAGQTQWARAVAGARLAEGDSLRAFAGASAELLLPDTSRVVLAENSRLLVSKLEFDPQQQTRLVLLHLAEGKLRAVVAHAGLELVRARGSSFAISTPTAVAAAKGTIVWVFTDGQQSLVAVEPEPGFQIPSKIECITLGTSEHIRQMVLAGAATTDCNVPVPTQPQFLTLSNPLTVNADLGANVVPPVTASVLALVSGTDPGTQPGVNPGLTNSPPVGLTGPPTFGNNQNVFGPPQPVCATDPCS